MKLNYREKVILAIVAAIAIMLAGFFLLIKPKNEDIKDHEAELETKQAEKQKIEADIARIDPLIKQIDKTYEETKKLTGDFVDASKISTPEKLDQYMQNIASETGVEIVELNVDVPKSSSIKYYYRTYETLLSGMMSSADLNGEYAAAEAKLSEESTQLSQRTAEDAISTEYGVLIRGTREQVFDYLKAVEDLGDTTLIKNVEINDYTFGAAEALEDLVNQVNQAVQNQPAETPEGEEGAENNNEQEQQQPEIQVSPVLTGESDGTSTVKIIISLYSVYDMPKPDTSA